MPDLNHPGPLVNHESAAFWQAVQRREFGIGHCDACGRSHWYPRSFCPFCFAGSTRLLQVSGQGVVYSYSVTRLQADDHVVAYVTLAEGPTLLTNIVGCPAAAVHIGQAVQLVYTSTDNGLLVPMFTPSTAGAETG